MQTQFLCAGIPGVTRTDSRITAIGPFAAPPATAGYQSLEYVAADSFDFDNNGFGGSRFLPSNKRTPVSATHDLYVTPFAVVGDGSIQIMKELQLWTRGFGGLQYATVGMLAEDYDGGSLCFFAAGAEASQIPTSNGFDHLGRIDGLSQLGGQTRRLHGSDFLLRLDYGTRRGTIEINLVACDDPFGNLASCATRPFGKITGAVSITNNTLNADLQGADGISGRLQGRFFSTQVLGVGLTFTLTDPAGRRAIGAAAGDLRLM